MNSDVDYMESAVQLTGQQQNTNATFINNERITQQSRRESKKRTPNIFIRQMTHNEQTSITNNINQEQSISPTRLKSQIDVSQNLPQPQPSSNTVLLPLFNSNQDESINKSSDFDTKENVEKKKQNFSGSSRGRPPLLNITKTRIGFSGFRATQYAIENSQQHTYMKNNYSFKEPLTPMLPQQPFSPMVRVRNKTFGKQRQSQNNNIQGFGNQPSLNGSQKKQQINQPVSALFSKMGKSLRSPLINQFNQSSKINLTQRSLKTGGFHHQKSFISDNMSESDSRMYQVKNSDAQNKLKKNFESLIKSQKRQEKNKNKNIKGRKDSREQFDHLLSRKLSLFSKHQTSDVRSMPTDEGEIEDGSNIETFRRIEKNFKRSYCTIIPDNSFKTFWDVSSCFIILHFSILFPMTIAFEDFQPEYASTFFKLSEIWFMIDVLINLSTGYYDKGVLIMERRKITIQYLRGWFFLDVFCAIPFFFTAYFIKHKDPNHSIVEQEELNYYDSISLDLQKMMVIRLTRFVKIDKLLIQIVTDLMHAMFRFFKLISFAFYCSHWLACLYYSTAFAIQTSEPKTWVNQTGLQNSSVGEKYVNALYWVVTTMATVGYGDIKPQTTQERLIAILVMLISASIYAFIINDIGHIVSREKMTYVNQYLQSKSMPIELIRKINKYLQFVWESKKKMKIDEEEVMSLLNEDLKNKITVYLNGQTLHATPLFQMFDTDFLSQLTLIFNKKSYSVDENIFVEKDLGDEIFFIIQGKKDDHFGEIGFILDQPRLCTAKSRDFTDCLTIKRQLFLEIASQFPQAIDKNTQFYDKDLIAPRTSIEIDQFHKYKSMSTYSKTQTRKAKKTAQDFHQQAREQQKYTSTANTKMDLLKDENMKMQNISSTYTNYFEAAYSQKVNSSARTKSPRIQIQDNSEMQKKKQSISLKDSNSSQTSNTESGQSEEDSKSQEDFRSKILEMFQSKLPFGMHCYLEEIEEDQEENGYEDDDEVLQFDRLLKLQQKTKRISVKQPSKAVHLQKLQSQADYQNLNDIINNQGQAKVVIQNQKNSKRQSVLIIKPNIPSQKYALANMKQKFQSQTNDEDRVKEFDLTLAQLKQKSEIYPQLKGINSPKKSQKNIRPLKGIGSNARIKKFCVKSSKCFAEDSIEDLTKDQFFDDQTSIQSLNRNHKQNRQADFQWQQQAWNKTSLQQMISSREDSLMNIYSSGTKKNDNANNLLAKRITLKKQSLKKKKQPSNKNNSSNNTTQQIVHIDNSNQNIVFNFEKSGTYKILYSQENQKNNSSSTQNLTNFFKSNNINWAINSGNMMQTHILNQNINQREKDRNKINFDLNIDELGNLTSLIHQNQE
eukprot:403372162